VCEIVYGKPFPVPFILRFEFKLEPRTARSYPEISVRYTVYSITFGSGKQLFPGLTAKGINSVRGALTVEIIDRLHFKL
jgi:hypothetical protein